MRGIIFIIFLVFTSSINAHQISTAYAKGSMNERGLLELEWQLPILDLQRSINLDLDVDGNLQWAEIKANEAYITQLVASHLTIARGGFTCRWQVESQWQFTQHFNQPYLVLPSLAQCDTQGELQLEYSLFFEHDSRHKLIFSLESQSQNVNRILSQGNQNLQIELLSSSVWATFKDFVYEGIIHIWIGIDHIAFLIGLLLTCVLIRRKNQWQRQTDTRAVLKQCAWIVSAFTLAHSITLTATALQWLSLPSRWVEAGIAATVALAALNNIFPLVTRLTLLTFSFGLLHGMGFAGVLGELGLPSDQQLLAILAFNLGVELGQLAIVAALLPILIILRDQRWYARYGMPLASAMIVVIAGNWFFDRI